jgi:thioredoxin-related protein
MKSGIILFILSFFLILNLNAQDYTDETDTVEVIKDFGSILKRDRYFTYIPH